MEQREIFPIVDFDPEYFARLVSVNAVGTFHCLKEEMKVIKDGGSIVLLEVLLANTLRKGCQRMSLPSMLSLACQRWLLSRERREECA